MGDQGTGVSGVQGLSGAGDIISGIGDLGIATADIIAATKGNPLPNTVSPTAVQQKPSTAATGSNMTWWLIGGVLVLGVVVAGVVYLFKSKKSAK